MIDKRYLMALIGVLILPALTQAQSFTTLYSFCSESGCTDGNQPYAGVIRDSAGNVYGTASVGGSSGKGVAYEVNSAGIETVLHAFAGLPSDGAYPDAPLVRDKKGNLYGTTNYGGSGGGYGGGGTVFKIDRAGNETLLHNFTGYSSDGCQPLQGLVVDKVGNIFGTTVYCGTYGSGAIFKLDSKENETILHSFGGGGGDGVNPEYGHLTLDKSGNLYGVAEGGGTYGHGIVYEINTTNGTFTVLHSFSSNPDGCWPYGSVVRDTAGNLYGTTWGCGSNDYGTIWKLDSTGQESVLHNFSFSPTDGCSPQSSVSLDAKGNLYGVTEGYGANNWGALYKLTAKGKFLVLHSFDYWTDGTKPTGEVLRTSKGMLLGTAEDGGANARVCTGSQYGCGTVWSYVP